MKSSLIKKLIELTGSLKSQGCIDLARKVSKLIIKIHKKDYSGLESAPGIPAFRSSSFDEGYWQPDKIGCTGFAHTRLRRAKFTEDLPSYKDMYKAKEVDIRNIFYPIP